jgi:hypothetical protein
MRDEGRPESTGRPFFCLFTVVSEQAAHAESLGTDESEVDRNPLKLTEILSDITGAPSAGSGKAEALVQE